VVPKTPVEMKPGGRTLADVRQHRSQALMRIDVVRIVPQRRLIVLSRFFVFGPAKQQVGEIDVRNRIVRMMQDRLRIDTARRGNGTRPRQQSPEFVQGAEMHWKRAQNGNERQPGIIEAANSAEQARAFDEEIDNVVIDGAARQDRVERGKPRLLCQPRSPQFLGSCLGSHVGCSLSALPVERLGVLAGRKVRRFARLGARSRDGSNITNRLDGTDVIWRAPNGEAIVGDLLWGAPIVFRRSSVKPMFASQRSCGPSAVTRDIPIPHRNVSFGCQFYQSPATIYSPGARWLRDEPRSHLRIRERTMPRFYFNVRDGSQLSHTDNVGEELADPDVAWTLAITYAGEILRTSMGSSSRKRIGAWK
jgi:hypothetical protein